MTQQQKLFGTNGIRGEANVLLTPELVMDIGRSVGTIVHNSVPEPEVLVGTDTRYSGDMLKAAMSAGLLSTGCRVVDAGVLATPALQYGVKTSPASMGIIITASHNPPEYNGIKCIAGDGTETSAEEERVIEESYHSKKFYTAQWHAVKDVAQRNDINTSYIKGILGHVNMEKIVSRRFRVVLDCANGATYSSSPRLLEQLGTRLTTLNAQPSGGFPAHPSEPTEDNLSDTIAMVKSTGADLGIAHDGDGDRTIFIDEKGCYIIGDRSLALAAQHTVRKKKGLVVTAINTSSVLEDVVKEEGGEVFYTPIGSPIVAREMIARNAVFGGEENGGLIFPEHQYCRDGAMAAAAILDIMAETEQPISELLKDLPEYHLVKLKFKYTPSLKTTILEKFAETVKDQNPSTMDGVKIKDDGGWVLVRPSGTEAIYRIQVEDRDKERAKQKAEETRRILVEIMESLG